MTSKILAGFSLIIWLAVLGPGGCGSDDPTPLVPQQDRYLHVSTAGSSDNDGTADSPLLMPNAAFRQAFLEGYQGVRLAAGQYVTYYPSLDLRLYGGIDVIGGCDPETWQPAPGQYSRLTANGRPLLALGIRTPTLVQGLDMYGPTTQYQSSSTAMYLEGCGPELQFEHCRFTSREGRNLNQSGGNGLPPDEATGPQAGGLGSCNEEVNAPGGWYGLDGCPGGPGGAGGLPGQIGQNGLRGCRYYGAELAAGGEPGLDEASGQDGADGRDGEDGQDGANAELALGLGLLREYNLLPYGDSWGQSGESGQGGGGGGGGGGSATGTGNGGGGGGTGGDRGRPGQGGINGGHSVAVISATSSSVFRHCLFTAANGGDGSNGGHGAAGADGTPGAPGGDACPGEVGRGGHGGAGGKGGCGGGGAGGHGGASYGMLVLGSVQPLTDKACVFVSAAPSTSGLGGQHGNDLSHAPDGIPGESFGLKIIPVPGEVVSID